MREVAIGFVVLSTAFLLEGIQSETSDPEEPFSVYVYTNASEDPEERYSADDAAEELRKKLQDREDWFRSAEKREDADIVVEVLRLTTSREAKLSYRREEVSTDPADGTTMKEFLDTKESLLLETMVHPPGGRPFEMTASAGRRLKDVAQAFARNLERFCRLNYEALMKNR